MNSHIETLAPKPAPLSILIRRKSRTLALLRNGIAFKTFPAAVGKPATPTPLGSFVIINKQKNPGGPYGSRWLGLSSKGYGIHGTNDPGSIGKSISNGCIRLRNADVESLFDLVSVGVPVLIEDS